MGAGVPVLVSRTGSFEELPDDAAGKIDVGDIEEELLLEYLLLLARRPDVREAMSQAARRYVAEHHTLEGAARGYLEFLVSISGRQGTSRSRCQHCRSRCRLLSRQAAKPKAAIQTPRIERHDDDPIAILAQAAAELGIRDADSVSLAGVAEAVREIIPGP